MTNATTPIEATFEMQRQSIKQTQQLFEQSLELQQNALETFLHNGISAQRSAQKQGTELLQQLVNAQFEQGADLLQQLFNAQIDTVESTLDDEQFRSAINSQLYDFEATQDEAWDEFESGFVEAFEALSAQQQRVVAQSVDAFLDAQQDAEQQTIQGVQQAQTAAQTVQQQTEQAAQAAEEATEVAVESAVKGAEEIAEESADAAGGVAAESMDVNVDAGESESDDESEGQDLESIEGLGATYADRLRSYGIESVEHLAQTDSETVADVAEISEEHATEWVTSAQSQA